ncbi:MAG: prolyl oligopeptidase family serine peptidase [Pseudomonadota bacterium]|nr:prolyl oligopeptidase family serine peptidase [Pseudomonadota bacterium]
MRNVLFLVGMSVVITVVWAQENKSVDPAWLFVPESVESEEFVAIEPVMGSDFPVELRFVELLDGVYAPIGFRKPAGDGPFPTVVFAHMNGGYGLSWIREWTQYGSGTLEEFLDAGYAVVWMRYRAEVDTAYGSELTVREFQGRDRWSRGPLEYEDAIEIVEYVRALPTVDADRVGWVGVSHGAEMLFKIASEYQGLRAGVASEPAASDYLARLPSDPNAPPSLSQPETMDKNTPEMQTSAVQALRTRIDSEQAMERIRAIDMPIFVAGRDRDHNQSTFRLAYELMIEAGKSAEWNSYDHDHHGFIFVQRNAEGVYEPDSLQQAVVADSIAFFDRYMAAP